MYSLLGANECVSAVRLLCRRAGGRGDGDLEALKAEYNALLSTRQDRATLSAGPGPELVGDPGLEAALLASFVEPPTENDILPPITREVIARTIEARDPARIARTLAGIDLARRDATRIDRDLVAVFDLVVNRIFCAAVPRNRGGSTHRAIGVIWANPPGDASRADLVEFLMHELTHHLLFVDDLCHRHYASGEAYAGPRSFAVSAIRRTARPLYCVFHSLVVAVEILCQRERMGHPQDPIIHPRSGDMIADCFDTIDSIKGIPGWERLMAPRGRQLLDLCEVALADLARGLSGGRAAPRPPAPARAAAAFTL